MTVADSRNLAVIQNLQLCSPASVFEQAYREMLWEYDEAQEKPVPFTLLEDRSDFTELLKRLQQYSENAPPGFVRHKSYWLVKNDKQIVGCSNLRLTLNAPLKRFGGHIGFGIRPSHRQNGYASVLLAQTLLKAKQHSLQRVLVTCDKSNVASCKVIERNGGVFESEDLLEGRSEITQRFWIAIP